MSNEAFCSNCPGACDERANCDDFDLATCWECQERGITQPEPRLETRDSDELCASSFVVRAFAVAA